MNDRIKRFFEEKDTPSIRRKVSYMLDVYEAKAYEATFLLSGGMANDDINLEEFQEDYLNCYRANKYNDKGEGFFANELELILNEIQLIELYN